MGKALFIAEKPSVAQEFAKALNIIQCAAMATLNRTRLL